MGKILKGVGKLVGLDMDGAKKASKEQAAATLKASEAVSQDNLLQAKAAQGQMEATQAQNAARAAATDLLGRPMDTADVDLTDGAGDDEDDLLGRKRGSVRNTYRQANGSANSGLAL